MTSMNVAGHGRKRARRHPPELWRVPVVRVARVTPRMARITVADPGLASFPGGGGDQHVVLYFYEPGTTLPEPLTLTSARTAFGQVRPAMRSYTVRRYDPVGHELDLDFVLHGADHLTGVDGGPASAWAAEAGVGDQVILVGPSPAYLPDPDRPEHLLVGDETALPAIGAMLAELPTGVRVRVILEVADADETQPLPSAAETDITWLYRDGTRPPGTAEPLLAAVAELGPALAAQSVWAAGERAVMQGLRSFLLTEGGLDRGRVRTTMYWRLGHAGGGSTG